MRGAWLFPSLAALLLSSCSIKEERAECPCRLEVDFLPFAAIGGIPDLQVRSGNYPPVSGLRDASSWHADIRKGVYTISVVHPGMQTQVGPDRITCPEGMVPDSIYAFAASVDCHAEKVHVSALARKQFCTVTLREKEPTPLQYAVRSRFAAFSRADLSPQPAPLSFSTRRDPDGAIRFRLPRQGTDSGLLLEVSGTEGDAWELPLGEWMEKAGYDWTLPSLEDFLLELDYTATRIQVRILDWDGEETLTLTI